VGGGLGTKHTSAAMVQFLEVSLKRGVDLLSIFGRYDQKNLGRITSDEFCSALSDLGLSSATGREALDLADKLKAATGQFVLYRRIVEELLRLADDTSGAADINVVDTVRSCLTRANIDLIKLRDVFEYYDRNRTGKVRAEDLNIIFEEAGARLKAPELDAIADKYSAGDSSWVQYSALLSAVGNRVKEVQRGLGSVQQSDIPEDLILKLRALLESLIIRGKDFRREFDKFDDSFTGSLPQSDFKDILLERFRAGISPKDLEILEKSYRDLEDPRKVNHVRLLHDLQPKLSESNPFDSSEDERIWSLSEDLRQKIRRRCDYLSPGELRRPYKHFARNFKARDGSFVSTNSVTLSVVTLADLSIALKDLGMVITSDQELGLFELISLSGENKGVGSFTYSDFVVFVCDPNSHHITWKLRRAISLASVSHREIESSLTYQDQNSSGYITINQFSKALKSCDIELSDSDVTRVAMRFDLEESQRVNVDQFLRFIQDQPYNKGKSDELGGPKRARNGGQKSLEGSETQSWGALKGRIEELLDTGYTDREVFALFDPERRGILDVGMVQLGARETGAIMTRAGARGVLRRMTLNTGGAVTSTTFFEAMDIERKGNRKDRRSSDDQDEEEGRGRNAKRNREDSSRERSRDGTSQDNERDKDFDSIITDLKDQISDIAKDDGTLPEKLLRKQLDRHSLKQDGVLSPSELSRALDRMGVKITQSSLSTLFDGMDRSRTGVIDIVALIDSLFLGGGRESRREREDRGERGKSREGKRGGERGRSRDSDRDIRGEREERSEREGRREESVGKGGASVRANGARVLFRKRPDLLEELLLGVGRVQKDRGSTLRDLHSEFKRSDRRSQGVLDKGDFLSCLNRFGFKLRKSVEEDLGDSLSESERGSERGERGERGVNYLAFIAAIEAEQGDSDAEKGTTMDRLVKRLIRDTSTTSMKELFTSLDREGLGEIPLDDFEIALDTLGNPLSRSEAKKIKEEYSANGHFIKYKSFLRMLSNPNERENGTLSSREKDRDLSTLISNKFRALSGLDSRLNRVVKDPSRALKEELSRFDINGDGEISVSELKRGFRGLKVGVGVGLGLGSIP
jgi:Ca2+-binding EF-hand superfamily protein